MFHFVNTNRGFAYAEFKDGNDKECSIQKSSAWREDGELIWLGIDNANPQICVYGKGWEPYPVPDCVSFDTRMHLTQEQVAALIPVLQHFVDTGDLPEVE
jgi:hypothetical protein